MATSQLSKLQSTIEEINLSYCKLIGCGGGGEVYRATWTSESRAKITVAAKKIPILEESSTNDELANEIVYLQQLDHPNIIKYYGHVVTKDHVVIVTEYAAKGSLWDYLQHKKSLPPALKLKWAIQGARGIKYLQENQVLHRDIKSPNLLITADDDLKICDFGISKNLTSTKTTASEKGTVRWLAPEAFTELQLSPTADIFAFGIVLWELETCEEPYPGMSTMSVMYKVGQNGLRPEIPTTCSSVLRDLMQLCWDGDRAKRPKVNEIIRQLQRCRDGDMTSRPNVDENKWQREALESDGNNRGQAQVMEYGHDDISGAPTTNRKHKQEQEAGLQWRYKHAILTSGDSVHACDWISENYLAVCRIGQAMVYKVNEATSHLAYTLRSAEWEGKRVRGAVASQALPCSILVICERRSYVYQYPANEASRETKKYKIQSKEENPRCVVANASVVIIHMSDVTSFIVCQLPDFTHQNHVETNFILCDLSISKYLLVMGRHEMVVKSVGNLNRTVYAIKSPDGCEFRSVSCRKNATELYAVCWHEVRGKWCVYKYTWNGSGKPSYHKAGCVIDDLRRDSEVWYRCLSVTSGGLMTVGHPIRNVRIYSLE